MRADEVGTWTGYPCVSSFLILQEQNADQQINYSCLMKLNIFSIIELTQKYL